MSPRKKPAAPRRSSRPDRSSSSAPTPVRAEALKRWFVEKGLRKAKVGAVDIDGVWRGKYVSLEKFFSAAKGGLGFCDVVFGWDLSDELYDNAEVTGWHTGYPDQLARVDLSTGRVIPWEPDTAAFL